MLAILGIFPCPWNSTKTTERSCNPETWPRCSPLVSRIKAAPALPVGDLLAHLTQLTGPPPPPPLPESGGSSDADEEAGQVVDRLVFAGKLC